MACCEIFGSVLMYLLLFPVSLQYLDNKSNTFNEHDVIASFQVAKLVSAKRGILPKYETKICFQIPVNKGQTAVMNRSTMLHSICVH